MDKCFDCQKEFLNQDEQNFVDKGYNKIDDVEEAIDFGFWKIVCSDCHKKGREIASEEEKKVMIMMNFIQPAVSLQENKQYQEDVMKAKSLFEEGNYEECIDLVNSMYGWAKGELDVEYTQAKAVWCLLDVGSEAVINGFSLFKNTTGIDSDLKYNVYHPIYDGAFMVYSTNELSDSIDWCKKENFDLWSERLL